MTTDTPAPPKVTDSKESVADYAHDSLLAALIYLTRHYQKLFSAESLTAGLPLKNNRLTPFLFVRAARRAGLNARVVERSLDKLSPHILPAVAIVDDNKAAVITEKSETGSLTVFFPDTGKTRHFARLSDFDAHFRGVLILVRPAALFELGPDTFVSGKGWFWDTIKQFWRVYSQVAAAAIVINLIALAVPLYIMNVYDKVVPNQAFETLWVLTIGIVTVFVFDFILKMLRGYFIDVAGRGADILLAGRLFQQVLNIRLGVHGTSAGAFANQLREFETLRDFFTSATLVTLIDVPFVFLFILIIAIIAGPLALVPLLAVPILLLVSIAVQRPLRDIIRQATHDLDAKHGHLVESINGLETIKSLNVQSRFQARWERYVGTVARIGLKTRLLGSLGLNFAGFVQQMVTVLVVFFGVYLIADNSLKVGALVAATILAGRTMAPLSQAVSLYARYQQAKTALDGLNQIMHMDVERPEDKNYVYLPEVRGEVLFQDVSFTYPNAPMESLKEVSFRIKPGEKVGIIGRTGSGKSTVLRLILNLYNPTGGQILLDGLEIRQLDPAEFRKHIAYVPQNLTLFSGTLRDNILMGHPEASSERVAWACNAAAVNEFVRRHPMGFDLPVGERGEALSGGQRQAVAIARALLRNAPIMLMDEPTSEMDNRTEDYVLKNLKEHLADKTLVVVTHKFTMLEMVDRLIVMDYGRVVADGPKDKVLQQLQKRAVKGAG